MRISNFSNALKTHVLVCLAVYVSHNACAAVSQNDYDALIQKTRGDLTSEQLAPAIAQLRMWHLDTPSDLRIVCDLAVLLDRAGDYQSSVWYYAQIVQKNAPAYAISAVAHASLKEKHFKEAEAAYRLLIVKTPDDINAHVGLIYAWMGQARIQEAVDYALSRLSKSEQQATTQNLPMLVALGELYEARKEWLQAAEIFQKAVRSKPDFRYAQRELDFVLRQEGAPYLVKYYTGQSPAELDDDEKYQLALADAALTIRFGEAQLDYEYKRSRVNTINIALAENSELTKRFGDVPATKFDRIAALVDRNSMQEAVDLYVALVAANISTPPYVKFAAANAYLTLEQPEAARDLILQGLKESRDDDPTSLMNAQIALIDAYSEAGQYREAETLSEQILANQSQLSYKGMAGLEEINSNYIRAYEARAQLLVNDDRLDRAEAYLTALRAQIPFNREIRSAWASLQVARDHPRAASDELSLMLIDDPTLLDAAIGRGETLLSLNEFVEAEKILPALLEDNPDNKALQNYATKLNNYGQPYYKIENTFGHGETGSSADSLTDATVYSAPLVSELGDNIRLLSHFVHAEGDTTTNETAFRNRLGVGFDYRARDIDVQAEIDHTLDSTGANGLALTLDWDLSDAWHEQAIVDTNVINLPAEVLAENISAKEAALNTTWSLNESRKVGADISTMRFSDDNMRNLAGVWWQERWVSNPIFKIDTVLDLTTSSNSELNRTYFNPLRDVDLNAEVKAEWMTWHRYRRSLKQRFELASGQYSQRGFGSGGTAGMLYEHEWDLDNDLAISYGAGRDFQPYDGIRAYRNYIVLNLSGRIK